MNKAARAVVCAIAALAAAVGATAPAEAELEPGPAARVVEVVDGDTVVLDDGSEVRLVGLQAPKLPLGRPDFEPWPLATEAKVALEAIVLGETVRLSFGGLRMDRHGRHLAHLHLAGNGAGDGAGGGRQWVQGAMLRQGWARVYSFADNRALVPEMLALEAAARADRRGIWADPFYAIRRVEETPRHLDTYQLVEARVLEANAVRGRIYLNFGMDWRSDFTIAIDRKDRRLFEADGFDPLALEGRLIRARGWIAQRNGPMLKVTHPEQIEVLE